MENRNAISVWLTFCVCLCVTLSSNVDNLNSQDGHLSRNGMPLPPTRDDIPDRLREIMNDLETSVLPQPIESSCAAFIHYFSEAASNFTNCSIFFSRPLRFCERCVDEYILALESYNLIMMGHAHDLTGALCSDVILNSDRVQIIEQTFTFIKKIWKECNCDACFFGYNLNTTHPELNNSTLEFLHRVNETQACFQNFTHGGSVEPFIKTNESVDPRICNSCREKYRELNEFYEKLATSQHGKICVDIIDIMNRTRLLWSKEYHCSRHEVDIVPVVLLSVFFCSLPVVFYVANKIHGTKAEKKLLKQKRLRESQMTTPVQHAEDE